MNPLKDFVLQFSGLDDGIHTFELMVDDKFFNEFEFSEIKEGKVKVSIQIDKQTTMMILDFAISGYITCVCDRCLENYQEQIKGSERIIVKFDEDPGEANDEIKVISSAENQIDLSQDIFEFITLLLPYKRTHPQDKKGKSACNPEIIKILEKLNIQKNTDPRWDELKKISLKN